jgi:Fe-S cluster biogenesis protein NfuA
MAPTRHKTQEAIEVADLKVEIQMKALVEQLSAYIETFHGGSVEYVGFDGKILQVRLGGACLGCPLSPNTLHGWVEGTVRQFFPDIEDVQAV